MDFGLNLASRPFANAYYKSELISRINNYSIKKPQGYKKSSSDIYRNYFVIKHI